MATARSIRSNAAPASNRPHTKHQSSSRPELRVVSNPRGNEQGNVVGRVIEWTRTRSAPLVHVAIAVIFLVGTLFGALMLRTQMVQNSFEAAQIETNINRLTQDIEDDQAKLDQLVANLPDKASDMGMVPQQGSVSIDLSGYQSNKGGTSEHHSSHRRVRQGQEPSRSNASPSAPHWRWWRRMRDSAGLHPAHRRPQTAQAATANRTLTVTLSAKRGRILDANGSVLAQSVERYTIVANPEAAQESSRLLAMTTPVITATKLTANPWALPERRPWADCWPKSWI